MKDLLDRTDGYSSADLTSLVKEAAMGPLRDIAPDKILQMDAKKDLRPININDFKNAMQIVTASVSK